MPHRFAIAESFVCMCIPQVASFGEDQVLNWVHLSEVSEDLILEYERSLGVLTEEKYGLISHTLVNSKRLNNSCVPPLTKKPKRAASWDAG